FGLQLLHESRVRTSNTLEVLHYSALYGLAFVLPLFLTNLRHLKPGTIGLTLAVQPIARAMAALFAGKSCSWCGAQSSVMLGTAIAAISFGGFCAISAYTPLLPVLILLFLLGAGTGLFVPSNTSILLNSLPAGRSGVGGGMLGTARNLG